MKILVTGGAGFIGSNIVDAFIAQKHDVVVVDDLSSGKKNYLNPNARFYEVDIRDQKKIEEIFATEKPEILDHHAAQIEVRRSVSDPLLDASINLSGLLTLLEAGRKNGLKKVIFASSGGAIYGDAKTIPTPEEYPPAPASPYGITKFCSEHYLRFYHEAYGIDYVALRYGNVYGPRQNPHGEAGVVAIFAKKLLAHENTIINGDGKQQRDFVFVEDVARANVKALTIANEAINIGTGVGTDINTIFQELLKITQSSQLEQHGEAKVGEQRVSILDCTKAQNVLQWKAEVSIADGLHKTVEYFKHEK